MSVEARRTITVAADPATVLAVVRDVAGQPGWWPGMLASEVLEHDADGRVLRARITNDVKVARDTFELVYSDAEDGPSWQLASPSRVQRDQRGRWRLAPTDEGGTEVTLELTIEASLPLPRLVQRRVVGDAVAGALSGLAAYLDA